MRLSIIYTTSPISLEKGGIGGIRHSSGVGRWPRHSVERPCCFSVPRRGYGFLVVAAVVGGARDYSDYSQDRGAGKRHARAGRIAGGYWL